MNPTGGLPGDIIEQSAMVCAGAQKCPSGYPWMVHPGSTYGSKQQRGNRSMACNGGYFSAIIVPDMDMGYSRKIKLQDNLYYDRMWKLKPEIIVNSESFPKSMPVCMWRRLTWIFWSV
jgi:hypothetical protein